MARPIFITSASLSPLRELKLAGMAWAYEATLSTPTDKHPEANELIQGSWMQNAKIERIVVWECTHY